MLALILGEIIAVILGNSLYVFISIPVLMIVKIITKKQVGLFVVIFLFVLVGFLLSKQAISESESIYGMSEGSVILRGKVSEIKEGSYGWNLYLVDVRLEQYKSKKFLVTFEEEPKVEIGNLESEIKIGNIVEISGQLKHFEVARNEGNFNSKEYYKSIGIYGKVECQKVVIIDDEIDFIRHWLYDFKKVLVTRLDKICNEEHSAIYKAMLFGDKNDIDSEIKDLYSLTGISHILAISGLHVSFIGMFIYSLLRKRFGFSLSASISIVLVVSFGLMSGMGIATVRAIVMFGLKLLGEVLGRIYDYVTAISLSGILLVLENPFVIFNSGFQMSFTAIIAITLVWPLMKNVLNIDEFWQRIISGLNISMLMNPIIAFNYFQLPTYSFLLNLIVVPLMSVVLVSGIAGIGISFIGAWLGENPFVGVWLGKICILPGNLILELYTFLCTFVSKLPLSNIIVGKPQLWVIALYYMLFLIFLIVVKQVRNIKHKEFLEEEKRIPKSGRLIANYVIDVKKKRRKLNMKFRLFTALFCFCLSLLIYNPLQEVLREEALEVTFLDVGQGDGIFVRTDNGTTVTIDGGSTSVESVGKYRIIPFLKSKGIKVINYAIITHTDTDHISGLMEMIEEGDIGVKVKNIVLPNIGLKDEMYLELIELAHRYDVNVLYISKGDKFKLGQVYFKCLYPVANVKVDDKNDSSTVLSVTYGNFSMLLTGDISTVPEVDITKSLLSRYTILKVAHHGSKYSTSEDFLVRTRPLYSIISVGRNNMYGHPSRELLDRLSDVDTNVLRTDYSGGIIVKAYDKGCKMKIYGYVKRE